MHSRNILLGLLALSTLATGCSRAAIAPATSGDGPMTAAERREIAREAARVVDKGAAEKLEKFGSKKELGTFLAKLQREQHRSHASEAAGDGAMADDAPSMSAAEPSPVAESKDSAKAEEGESITNTQEAGVDEGGIVKTHGDHLVVLRRGRLFTVDIARRAMRPISSIDVSPEAGHDAWYDEMLITGDTIVVVGFSYQVNATEIGLFEIDGAGRLKHEDTFFLRSNDYYSSRNYASRLLGDKLVFYMPYALPSQLDERNPDLPGVMPWQAGGKNDWQTIIDATDIYRPIQETSSPVLHTVVTCDLGGADARCNAKAIVGPYGRSFYVSGEAVYVWVHDGYGASSAEGDQPPAAVYRFPLDGGDPGALRVWGAPVDQFSFKEGSDGFLNVMVMASSAGDRMWGAELAGDDVAMLRVPVATMMDGVQTVNRAGYVDLAEPTGQGYAFQNRFVGDHLLYGRGSSWGEGAQGGASLSVVPIRDPQSASTLALPHGVDRIEPMGSAAVVVGTDGTDLHFTSISLGDEPDIADELVQPNASQGETRSHGFFFKPSGEGDGTLGLPIAGRGRPGYEQLVNGSAEVLFLGVDNLGFRKLGSLASDPNTPQDDRCTVSCVDWYGNARPIFYKGRVFALLGYELVEGDISRGRVRETGRANMLSALGRGRGGVVWKDI